MAALLGRTVEELLSTVTAEEMEEWHLYYEMHPFDDYHRYHRPAALVSCSLSGGEINEALKWLHPIPESAMTPEMQVAQLVGS